MTAEAPMQMTSRSMVDPIWRGAKRLAIVCSLDAGNMLGHEEMARKLCGSVAEVARAGTPVEVEVMSIGDAVRASDAVLLLVHAGVMPAATVAPGASGQMLAFTMRTYRHGPLSSTPALFGAAPKVARYGAGGVEAAVLKNALSRVLPWVSGSEVSRLGPIIEPQE